MVRATLFVYITDVLKRDLGVESSKIMVINFSIISLWLLLVPLMGFLSDLIERKLMMRTCALALFLFSYPLFYLISKPNLSNILILQVILTIIGAGAAAACAPLVTSLYSTAKRYSGTAFGWSTGVMLFGGCIPFFSTQLVIYTGDPIAPAFILMFCGIIGFFSTFNMKKERLGSMCYR